MTTIPAGLAISVTGLRKSYGDQVVLDGIDLAVPEGTIFSLLGPNGAGKTTVVQILSTLINADGGELRVAGHDLSTAPDAAAEDARALARIHAEHGDLPGTAHAVALEDLDRGRLAGAVRAEQAEHLAALHGEIDSADGLELAVGLAQSGDRDGQPGGGGGHTVFLFRCLLPGGAGWV